MSVVGVLELDDVDDDEGPKEVMVPVVSTTVLCVLSMRRC